jgi:uncharacterized membrane protein YeiB
MQRSFRAVSNTHYRATGESLHTVTTLPTVRRPGCPFDPPAEQIQAAMAGLVSGAWTTGSVPVAWTAAVAHTLTGYAGGIGLAAAVGLLAIRIGRDRGRLITALAALGQRSLTFYLFQSAVWLVLFYPFTLDLRDDMGFAAAFGIGIATWILTILLAEWMRRAGHRGPAEIVLRRLSYRRQSS